MNKIIVLAVDTARYEPGRHVTAAAQMTRDLARDRAVLNVADERDARMLVLGSSSRTDLPVLPFGSVSNRLLHLASRPVLIVPMRTAAQPEQQRQSQVQAAAI